MSIPPTKGLKASTDALSLLITHSLGQPFHSEIVHKGVYVSVNATGLNIIIEHFGVCVYSIYKNTKLEYTDIGNE